MLPGCFLMLGEPRPVRAPVGLVRAATTRCPKAVELDWAWLGAADIAAAACRFRTRLDAMLASDLVKDAPDLVGGARGQLIKLHKFHRNKSSHAVPHSHRIAHAQLLETVLQVRTQDNGPATASTPYTFAVGAHKGGRPNLVFDTPKLTRAAPETTFFCKPHGWRSKQSSTVWRSGG